MIVNWKIFRIRPPMIKLLISSWSLAGQIAELERGPLAPWAERLHSLLTRVPYIISNYNVYLTFVFACLYPQIYTCHLSKSKHNFHCDIKIGALITLQNKISKRVYIKGVIFRQGNKTDRNRGRFAKVWCWIPFRKSMQRTRKGMAPLLE